MKASTPIFQFMTAVLGDEAACALRKAADQTSAIETVLGPRVILGWVKLISRYGYDDAIPGLPGTSLTLNKSDDDSTFSGEVRFGKQVYDFDRQNVTHVAAALSCALGVDKPVAKSLRDNDIFSLGEQVDLLMKTQLLKVEESSSTCACGTGKWEDRGACEVSGCDCTCHQTPEKKFEAPGPQAGQNAPSGFQAPVAQTGKAPGRTAKKGFGAKLTMSQARTKCSVCDATQFVDDVFVGCHCLRDLAKYAEAEAVDGGYKVTFDKDFWSKNDVAVLMDIVSGKA